MINLYDKEEFTKFYLKRKEERYLDKEIAKELHVSHVIFSTLKTMYDLHYGEKIRRNKQGLTEEDFRKGEQIGLTRRTMLRRRRDGWSIRRAITTPIDKTKQTHRRKRK